MLTKEIIPFKTNDVLVNMFLSQYGGFELTLEYDKDNIEYILGLSPISDVDDTPTTPYVYLSQEDMNNPIYTYSLVYDSFKKDSYAISSAIDEVIKDVLSKMKDKIIDNIQVLLIKANNKCPYCGIKQEHLPLNNDVGTYAYIEGSTLVFTDYRYTNISIKYCPMCGRRLGD